jgi:hypothetical protein
MSRSTVCLFLASLLDWGTTTARVGTRIENRVEGWTSPALGSMRIERLSASSAIDVASKQDSSTIE